MSASVVVASPSPDVALIGGAGDCLEVVGSLAGAGWRGHSPAEGAGCLLLSAPFCRVLPLVDSCKRIAQLELSPSFPSDILQNGEPTKLYSRSALSNRAGITDRAGG